MWWQGKNYRLYWKYNSKWELIFEKFWKALHKKNKKWKTS